MDIKEETRAMKEASPLLAAAPIEKRNCALERICSSLQAHKDEIFAANREDLAAAEETGVPAPVKKRLRFDEGKLADVTAELTSLISLPDPIGLTDMARELDDGLTLYRVTCPIGVIGVIFEARPDAMVQISALCLKSGNCAVLKGGKETLRTNRVLFRLIHEAALAAGLPEKCLLLAEQHNEIDELLTCHDSVDLLIPRGSNAFVQYIMNHTNIPVLGHADGVCHIYAHSDCDIEKAIPIILDAKTQYTAACNAAETLLVHRDIAAKLLPPLKEALDKAHVRVRGDETAVALMGAEPFGREESWHREYLDLILSVKIVNSEEEAIAHINRYGSHHTDCILTEDNEAAEKFMTLVDSAGVYQNCSTRFADGFRYGFGAEVGISTSKIHARGPVGLDGLISYKYRLFGHGQTAGDYASGKKHFRFRDL